MAVKFLSKQSPETKPLELQNYVSPLELVTIVIAISDVVISGYSREDLK